MRPIRPGLLTMYACGPTVYRYAHVGNLRTFMLPDLIRRAALYSGLDVRHVQNITDVGHLRDEHLEPGADPMLVAAGLEGRPPAEIADAYEAAFHADAARINLLSAHAYPRATEHIAEMLAIAERLEALGHAYVTPLGNVYYAVASYPAYGRLSGNTLEGLRAGHRGGVEPDKRDPADFALWKAAGTGRLLTWPSRWGEGFPGWHLECSAMAMRHLGEHFDLHTGGEDNVFPHHEDEIAQSAPLVGGAPANLWVHAGHLLTDGRKMAKSAGNFQRITELEEEGIEPLAFRYLCLTARYSRRLEYSDDSLDAAARALRTLRRRLRALGPPPLAGPWEAPAALVAGRAPDRPTGTAAGILGHAGDEARHGPGGGSEPKLRDRTAAPAAPLSPHGRDLHDAFVSAIDDDLDMPSALATVHAMVRADLPPDERRWLTLDADFVLGLDLHRAWRRAAARPRSATRAVGREARRILEERQRARAAGDWATADTLREELRRLGHEPVDRADGTTVLRRPEAD